MSSRTPCAAIVVLTIFVSYLITSIRFYSRYRSKNEFRWNLSDTIIVTALVLQAFLTGIGLTWIYLPDIEDPQTALKVFVAGTFLYYSTLWSIKISISVSLVRLTKQLDLAARLAKCCFYLICVAFVAVILAELCQCIPMSTLWERTCDTRRITAAFWTTIGLNIGTDIMLVIIPFSALSLLTERRIRITISIVFGLAGFAVIISVVRAILVAKDAAKASNLIVMLSHIEVATGVIISAVPEVSRSFTRLCLRRPNTRSYENGMPANRQQTQNTSNRIILSTDEKKKRFANLRVESSHNRLYDIEGESANGRAGTSSEQSIWEFHNTASTDQISPYPIKGISLTHETQGKEEIIKTTMFEMKVL